MGETDTTGEGSTAEPAARLARVTNANVLVTGPPMAGKTDFALDVVGAASREGRDVLVVTTTRSAPRLLEGRDPADVSHLIDCTPVEVTGREWVTNVSSPADLTGISMPLSSFLDGATAPVLVFDSTSTLLMYTEQSAAFRFLSVLTTHIRQAGGLGLYTLDAGSHTEQAVRTFAQLFDGRVELRSEGGLVEVKGTGVNAVPSEWTPR